ncbi:hypothetical protein AMECASPLE_007290 [Ameca splendens]|uniref:Uncharacterized protein n=1 Tax=Ameca splendens TaxID=208324 RepID=A0ABV0Z8G0_9TELE
MRTTTLIGWSGEHAGVVRLSRKWSFQEDAQEEFLCYSVRKDAFRVKADGRTAFFCRSVEKNNLIIITTFSQLTVFLSSSFMY